MWLDPRREVIESNVYCIPERLREIDSGYFVVYNHSTRQFEVHHKEQLGDTFCLSIPYPELDCRTIQRVRETRVERAHEIWAVLRKQELTREMAVHKKLDDEATPRLKEIHRYVNNHESKDTIPDDAYTTRFI